MNLKLKRVKTVNDFINKNYEEIILFLGVFLISLLSYSIGYINAKNEVKEPIIIEKIENNYERSE